MHPLYLYNVTVKKTKISLIDKHSVENAIDAHVTETYDSFSHGVRSCDTSGCPHTQPLFVVVAASVAHPAVTTTAPMCASSLCREMHRSSIDFLRFFGDALKKGIFRFV